MTPEMTDDQIQQIENEVDDFLDGFAVEVSTQADTEQALQDSIEGGTEASQGPEVGGEQDSTDSSQQSEEQVAEVPETSAPQEAEKASTSEAPQEEHLPISDYMRTQLDQMARMLQQQQAELAALKGKKVEEPALEDKVFVTDDEYDNLVGDPKAFNSMLNKVYRQALADSRELLLKNASKELTPFVKEQINQHTIAAEFYRANPDLVKVRSFVGHVADEVAAQNPDLELADILAKVAPEVRKRLGEQQAASGARPVVQNPGFAGSNNGAKRPARSTPITPDEKELADINEFLGFS